MAQQREDSILVTWNTICCLDFFNSENIFQNQTKSKEVLAILTGGLWYMLVMPTESISIAKEFFLYFNYYLWLLVGREYVYQTRFNYINGSHGLLSSMKHMGLYGHI